MVEIFKHLNDLSSDIMNEVFTLKENPYNLRNHRIFRTENPCTNRFGLDSIGYRGSQIWQ